MFSNEAFVQTEQQYMDTIYRVAYGWLKNPDDANDVTQDVQLSNGEETVYMTIKYQNGYAMSSNKYISPKEFN